MNSLGINHYVPTRDRAGRLLLPLESEDEQMGQKKEDQKGEIEPSLHAMCYLPLLPLLLQPEIVLLGARSTALAFGKGR